MDISKVYRWISKLPCSDYYGLHPKTIATYLDKNEAYRCLAMLIVMNYQSENLMNISETDPIDEASIEHMVSMVSIAYLNP